MKNVVQNLRLELKVAVLLMAIGWLLLIRQCKREDTGWKRYPGEKIEVLENHSEIK